MVSFAHEMKNAYIGDYKEWIPGANTLAYYPLETDTKDYSGNSRDGTNSNVTFSDGVANFNGSNSVITIAHADWQKPTSNFTILAWFKAGTTNQEGCIVGKAQWSPYYQTSWYYSMGVSGKSSTANTWAGFPPGNEWTMYPTHPYTPANTPLNAGEWHLLGLTNDGTLKCQYFDGELVASATKNTVNSNENIPLTIGNITYYSGNEWFNGSISKVIIENKTRTEQEFIDYYNNTKSNYGL